MTEAPDFKLLNLPKDAEVLVSPTEIRRGLARIADALNDRYAATRQPPLVLCVMTGAMVFVGQLLPLLMFPLQLDYVHASRYRGQTRGGRLELLVRPRMSVAGRDLLLLDDIFDEGDTLAGIAAQLRAEGAASLQVAVLVEKLHDRKVAGFAPDLVGVSVPDRYVFGCGMDYGELYRNLPAVYALREASEASGSAD